MLSLQRIESGYGESNVLRGVNLDVLPGQVVCLMGRNGVGKTTLMKTLMGLLKTGRGHPLERAGYIRFGTCQTCQGRRLDMFLRGVRFSLSSR